ncbi:AAA family ATPase [Rhizophagus clarus]|uniref:AAA family ATPase n=1 Tax=Rhizophagus clarus TaxID=94130 RepID=A0A8H3KW66_9GLOM|nr:AAA family ATPase [Rhizophagus clarus]
MSSVWKVFYPLFLHESQRQDPNSDYVKLLQNIRFGNIDDFTWNMLQIKLNQTINASENTLENLLNTTHIVGHKEMAYQINQMICTMLPTEDDKHLISNSTDIVNGKIQNNAHYSTLIKQQTNLPSTVRLQVGARVMFLNNSQYKHKIANETIGTITDIDIELQEVRSSASRTQFPLINAFALTSHKVQALTLPDISLDLNSQMFEKGQAYVAISRCKDWNNVKIKSLSREAFVVDRLMIKEYERL